MSPTSYPNPALTGWRLGPGVQQGNPIYRLMRRFFQVTIGGMWKVRVFDRCHEPTSGSALYICNHQSFLDPMLMSFALRRPMNYMARDSLFRSQPFKWMIETVNAFPVRRNTADTGAIKEAIRRLKAGGQVVIFAEGTRTRDGRIAQFMPGIAMLAQRFADWTVPVVIDGAFEAWPRTQALPSGGSIVVQYAPPIPQHVVRQISSEEFVRQVRGTLISMQAGIRQRVGRPGLNYD